MKSIENFDSNWEVYNQNSNSTIYYKNNNEGEDSKTLTFGGECIINAPMIYPVAILGEHEMLKDWIPFLSAVDVLHQRSLFKRLLHIKLDLPFPVSNRDLVCEVVGFPLKEEKAYGLLLESERSGSYFGIDVDDHCEGRVRMDLKYGFFYLEQIDENTCKFKMILNVDTKMNLGQGWSGKMIMSKIVSVWIHKMIKNSTNFKNTKFAHQLIKNPLYRFASKKISIPIPTKEDLINSKL